MVTASRTHDRTCTYGGQGPARWLPALAAALLLLLPLGWAAAWCGCGCSWGAAGAVEGGGGADGEDP